MCLTPVSVICRPRPPHSDLTALCGNFHISADRSSITLVGTNSRLSFAFDHVFDFTATQKEVFEYCGEPAVGSMFDGYNAAILAYGQTGSGKTFTTTGIIGDEEGRGLGPRIITRLFEGIAAASESIEFSVKFSYCEIYMERITDLLDPLKTNLKMHEEKGLGLTISGITERYVSDDEELLGLMLLGNENRHTSSTAFNDVSSRSHAVMILTVAQNNSEDGTLRSGKLHLVDLAGAEMAGRAQVTGKRLDEAKLINKSLTTLGIVVRTLAEGEGKHIPYRDSKLTRLLQDALGGNSRTTMLITCSPDPECLEETANTFRFAAKAKEVRTLPKENKETTISELRILLAKTELELALRTHQLESIEQSMETSRMATQEEPEGEDKDTLLHENERLMEIIDDLQSQLAEEIAQRVQLQDDCRELQERNLGNDHTLLTLKATNVQLLNEKQKLTEDLTDKDEQIAILTQTSDVLAKKVAELRVENEKLDQKNREQARIIDLREQENPRLAEIISQKEAQVQELQRKLEDTEISLTQALKRTQCDLSADQYIQEIANSQESLLKAHNQLAYLQNLLNDRDRAMSTQRPDYSLYKSIGYQEAMSMWEMTKKQLQRDLDDRIQKVVLLEIEVDEAHESYRRLSEEMRQSSLKDAPKVTELEAELDKLQRSFQKLLSDQSKYQVQIEVLERKLKRKSEKRREAEEKVREMNERLAEAAHTLERRSSEMTELRLHGGFARSVMGYNSSKLKKLVKGGASNM